MTNTLFTQDNLFILHGLNSESVDLIYLDPPFNSKRTYAAPIGSKAAGSSFKDMWTWKDINQAYLESLIEDYPHLVRFIQSVRLVHSQAMMAYLTYMTQRLIQLHRILTPTGSLYLHCDPTASHYLKVILDSLFGKASFRNEIAWHYYNGATTSNKFYGRKHDAILFYCKDPNTPFQNIIREPHEKTSGWMKQKHGRETPYGKPHPGGKRVHDVWRIPSINNMSKERTGYPTQKPLALLHRIIKVSSREGEDVVLDPFCGCATTCVAAQQLGRKWIGIDIERQAASLLVERLSDDAGFFKDFVHRTDIPHRTDVTRQDPTDPSLKVRLYREQEGKCKGCDVKFETRNLEIDYIVPKSKGGGDYIENYQLLCGHCNRTKGDRPMEYLRNKIKVKERLLVDQISFGE